MTERTGTACYRHPDRPTRLACSECGRPICPECSHDAAVGQKCPECAAPRGRHVVVDARRRMSSPGLADAPVTFTIIGLTVLAYLLSGAVGNRDVWIQWGQFNFAVSQGEIWRMFTAMLLHSGVFHILFNMYLLYRLGPRLEQEAGSTAFALLYFGSGAAGGAAYYLMTDLGALAIGASGAISGIFGVWFWIAWRIRHTPAGRALFNEFGLLLAINLVFPFFVANVAWQAHLGGFLAGIAIGAFWGEVARRRDAAALWRSAAPAAILAVAVAAVLIA